MRPSPSRWWLNCGSPLAADNKIAMMICVAILAVCEAAADPLLLGKHFNIMTVEDPPFVSVRKQPFNSSSEMLPEAQWDGWIVDVISETAKAAGFTYTLHLNMGNTFSYGAAVNAVVDGDGKFDMYWAGAYITTSRLASAVMTTPFHTAPLSVIVPHRDTDSVSSIWKSMSYIFLPFEETLWICVLGVIIFSGVAYAFSEPMNHIDFKARDKQTSLNDVW